MPPPRQAHWGSRIEEVHSTESAALQPPFLLVQILQRWTQIDPPSTVCSLSRLRGRVREGALSTADSVHVAAPHPGPPPQAGEGEESAAILRSGRIAMAPGQLRLLPPVFAGGMSRLSFTTSPSAAKSALRR